MLDELIIGADKMLRVASGVVFASRPNPGRHVTSVMLDENARQHSAALMRVNHVGEVCAQALYAAQSRFALDAGLREQFRRAGREEEDHLAWTAERVRELGSHTSLLNPFWYAGAFVLGAIAARAGDAVSLGFVVETERQVEAHLASHLESLPPQDEKSRLIVDQMRLDEIEHGAQAQALGAEQAPALVQFIMRAMAKVMTTMAYHI